MGKNTSVTVTLSKTPTPPLPLYGPPVPPKDTVPKQKSMTVKLNPPTSTTPTTHGKNTPVTFGPRADPTYGFKQSGEKPTKMKYDPKSGEWIPSYGDSNSGDVKLEFGNFTDGSSSGGGGEVSGTGGGGKDSASGKAQKEQIEIEVNTLTAEVPLIPSNKTLAIKVRDTVSIYGVGKYLSGNYYVTDKTVTLDTSSGITISISVIKSKFADNMKTPTQLSDEDLVTVQGPEPRVPSFDLDYSDTLRVGDKVRLADPSELGVSSPVARGVLTVSKVKEDNTKVLLRELFCWVETEFVDKV